MATVDTNPEPARLDVATVYQAVRTEIAATDEISFKLMGLVPLVSGAGLLGLVFTDKGSPQPGSTGAYESGATALTVLCLFAAWVTLGLFRWELRNVQNCKWQIDRACALEVLGLAALDLAPWLLTRPKAPQCIGKEIAEKCIYGGTIGAWLAMPFAIGAWDRVTASWQIPLAAAAAAIGVLTVLSFFSSTKVAPDKHPDGKERRLVSPPRA